ncbi:MAG: hypothetical protein IJV40_03190 [Oscillospiraceae bacterium]|nr:hypothetical protein [Oscillospiraceae bacterium]
MEQLTPAEKAALTRRERTERKQDEIAAARNDKIRAVEICRQIRDNPAAADRDKLDAIRLLRSFTT